MGSIGFSSILSTQKSWMMLRTLLVLSVSGFISSYGSPTNKEQEKGLLDSSLTRQDVARKGYSCEKNSFDRNQWCLCKPGERVSEIHSVHKNSYEDREWTLNCSKIQPEFRVTDKGNWYNQSEETKFHDTVIWLGGAVGNLNQFLVGMTSDHSNPPYEDRKFKFFSTHSENWYLTDCKWHYKINEYDRPLDWTLGEDEVIASLYSVFSKGHRDRVWDIMVCKLRQRCTEIYDIKYDFEKQDVSNGTLVAGREELDNTKAKLDNSYTATITQASSESLTESYKYSKTSGFTNQASMTVKAGAKIGVPAVTEWSYEMSASFSQTFSFRETWTRGNSKKYSESTGKKMTFNANCKAGCKCKMNVVVKTAKGVIPYTIFSQSPKEKGERHKCIEYGELTVDYSFNAKATIIDEC